MNRVTDIPETVNQAIRYVKSDPCCICSYECKDGSCRVGVKYKGTCKVYLQLKSRLSVISEMEE